MCEAAGGLSIGGFLRKEAAAPGLRGTAAQASGPVALEAAGSR